MMALCPLVPLLIKAIEALLDWHNLGLYLDVPLHTLKTIAMNHPGDVVGCRVAMVETWLKTNPSATWEDVMEAIGKLSDMAIAQTIKQLSPDQGNHNHHHVLML